jgi:hypothetical protein
VLTAAREGHVVEPYETTYLRGELSAEQLREEISGFWAELKTGSEVQAEVDGAGLNSGVLNGIERAGEITVRVESSGADPASVLLVIAFAPAANRVLKDLWATVLLPRIRRRWGDDAIGREVSRRDR